MLILSGAVEMTLCDWQAYNATLCAAYNESRQHAPVPLVTISRCVLQPEQACHTAIIEQRILSLDTI